jgi:hypothetical protein
MVLGVLPVVELGCRQNLKAVGVQLEPVDEYMM